LKFERILPLQVVSKTKCTISAVRNYGATLARGRVLTFLDADCMAPPEWLETLLAAAKENSIWGAPYMIPLDATWVGRVWFKYQAVQREGQVSFLPGGNLCIARQDFLRIGGFDEIVSTSEDVEICARARKQGMQIVAHRTLAVFHEGTPRTLRGFYRQNRWHGEHVMRMFLDSLPSLRLLPIIALSAYTLLMFWAAMLVPLIALPFHRWRLSILPLLLLVAPSILLSLRKTANPKFWLDGPPLSLLYLTYFLSRAAALTRVSPRSHR
jgi:GT2 family glycosyltransferase